MSYNFGHYVCPLCTIKFCLVTGLLSGYRSVEEYMADADRIILVKVELLLRYWRIESTTCRHV